MKLLCFLFGHKYGRDTMVGSRREICFVKTCKRCGKTKTDCTSIQPKGNYAMIKPIDLTRKRSFGYINWYSDRTEERPGVQVLEQKINEIIEAINYLLTRKDKK